MRILKWKLDQKCNAPFSHFQVVYINNFAGVFIQFSGISLFPFYAVHILWQNMGVNDLKFLNPINIIINL